MFVRTCERPKSKLAIRIVNIKSKLFHISLGIMPDVSLHSLFLRSVAANMDDAHVIFQWEATPIGLLWLSLVETQF